MKKLFFIFFILSSLLAKNPEIDSLLSVLENVEKIEKVDVLNKLSKSFLKQDLQKAKEYAKRALEISQKIKYYQGEQKSTKNLAMVHYFSGEYVRAKNLFEKILQYAKDNNDQKSYSASLNNLGAICNVLGEKDIALGYYLKAKDLNQEIKDSLGLSYNLKNISNIYLEKGYYVTAEQFIQQNITLAKKMKNDELLIRNYVSLGRLHDIKKQHSQAIENFLKALDLSEKNDYFNDREVIYSNLGISNYAMENYDKALQYFQQAIEIEKQIGLKRRLAFDYNNISLLYKKINDYDKALFYAEKSLVMEEELGDQYGLARSLNNIAVLNLDFKKYDLAKKYLDKSLEINQKLEDKEGITQNYMNLGIISSRKGDKKEAEKYFQKSLMLAEENDLINNISDNYKNLVIIYEDQEDFAKAFAFQKKLLSLKDSLNALDNEKTFHDLQLKYETKEKEKKNLLLKKENEFKAIQISRQKLLLLFFAILLIVTISIAAAIYYKINLKNSQQNLLLERKSRMEIFGRIASGFSHKIRPLSINIDMNLSNIELSMDDDLDKAYLQKKIKQLRGYNGEIQKYYENLRAYIKEDIRISLDKLAVHDILRKTCSILDFEMKKYHIELDLKLAENELFVIGNKDNFNHIILTIVSNAIDAIREKNAKYPERNFVKKIMIRTFSKKDKLILEIEDNGIGIAKKDQQKIFEPFYSTKEDGTGLALPLVEQFVQDMKGKIEVESELEKFTIFRLILKRI